MGMSGKASGLAIGSNRFSQDDGVWCQSACNICKPMEIQHLALGIQAFDLRLHPGEQGFGGSGRYAGPLQQKMSRPSKLERRTKNKNQVKLWVLPDTSRTGALDTADPRTPFPSRGNWQTAR